MHRENKRLVADFEFNYFYDNHPNYDLNRKEIINYVPSWDSSSANQELLRCYQYSYQRNLPHFTTSFPRISRVNRHLLELRKAFYFSASCLYVQYIYRRIHASWSKIKCWKIGSRCEWAKNSYYHFGARQRNNLLLSCESAIFIVITCRPTLLSEGANSCLCVCVYRPFVLVGIYARHFFLIT